MMDELNNFGEELVTFISETELLKVPEFYYDALLNYLGVTYLGAKQQAISIVLKTLLDDHQGKFQPLNRLEKVSLLDVALVDCFSSAIQANDDIHFTTTTHPCGPVLSAILALARIQKISLKEALNALYIGMEVECRVATLLFDQTDSSSNWYTTGIAGGIGATGALSHLLKFNRQQIKSAIGLASNLASGIRGSHGSMTGSFIPAIACQNGLKAVMLVKNGFTCSFNSFIGQNGLVRTITKNPAINSAGNDFNHNFLSMKVSCKPYPYGFIAFATIAALSKVNVNISKIKEVKVMVSPRVKQLGANYDVKTMYDGFVSLPYIISHLLIDYQNAHIPLDDDFKVTEDERNLMKKVKILENIKYGDQEVKIIIDEHEYYINDVPGSIAHPMQHQEVINKFIKITQFKQSEQFINALYQQEIDDIYQFIITNLNEKIKKVIDLELTINTRI